MEHTAATGSPSPAATQRQSAGTIPDAWVVDTLADSSDLVIAIDPEATIRWCNATALPMLGYEPESVIGRSFADFVHPDDLGRARPRSWRSPWPAPSTTPPSPRPSTGCAPRTTGG